VVSSSSANLSDETVAVPDAVYQSVGFLLALLGAESRRRFGETLAAHQLRLSHYGVLMTLANVGPISQQSLARAIGIDPRNVVPVIDALEERGLLERGVDPDDRRRHRIGLTSEGHASLERLRESGERLEQEMLAGLDETERTVLRSVLGKLHRSLDANPG
jgi:MarR family transcriptional regulator, lower aerobic nicotinate degradation pathway regulator